MRVAVFLKMNAEDRSGEKKERWGTIEKEREGDRGKTGKRG
jgi:hypothetical protein